MDSNHRRRKPADLQSAPVGRLGIPPENQLSLASLVPLPVPCRLHSGAARRREVDDSGHPALRPPGRAACASRSNSFQTNLSNHRRRKPADLQSAPVGRLGIPPENQLSLASLVPLPVPCRLHSGARRRREVDDSGHPALRPPGRAACASRSNRLLTALKRASFRCGIPVRRAFGPTKAVYFRDARAMCQYLPDTAAHLFAFFGRTSRSWRPSDQTRSAGYPRHWKANPGVDIGPCGLSLLTRRVGPTPSAAPWPWKYRQGAWHSRQAFGLPRCAVPTKGPT